jgi:hypothetical protein
MKTKMETRNDTYQALWCKYGCPEKMTIHVKTTGETITLINGLPVTLNGENKPLMMPTYKGKNRELRVTQPVTDNCTCLACLKRFYSKRTDAKFCSSRCRIAFHRKQEADERRRENERLLAAS